MEKLQFVTEFSAVFNSEIYQTKELNNYDRVVHRVKGELDYFLYIAESKIKPPFWGINKNTVNRLNSQTIPYGIVMLNSNSISSYFMLSDIFNSIKDDLSTNANQYLLTPTYLCEEEEFITIEELKNKLLSAF